jgi:hypothetical protein
MTDFAVLNGRLTFGDAAQIKALRVLNAELDRTETAKEQGGGWYWVNIEVDESAKVFFDETPDMADFDIFDYIDRSDIHVTFTKTEK